MKHYTIPFFIPHRGCPHKCVFCDQRGITSEEGGRLPSSLEISEKIEKYLATMPASGTYVQVGFFGGSFTGIPYGDQIRLLSPVKKFLNDGRVKGIRLSTRPDMIDREKVDLLVSQGVKCVELGVQSMRGEVLDASGRGHTPEHTVNASHLILERGLTLAHQIMLGLPLSTYEKELFTAQKAVDLGASQVRIYPVVVIEGTELAEMWRRKDYKALEMDEAVDRAAKLISLFNKAGVRVIRCGLHPSEGLIGGDKHLAGPFHPAFGHLARERSKNSDVF
jgi:histone acetyltransferase (RNA polymerase elongator complex component)